MSLGLPPLPLITRFAPSPTGYLHFGNIRTALFNWLAAKNSGGVMQLRIEDTDRARNEKRYVDGICEDLAWLRLDWRGAADGGPWRQSQRRREHEKSFAALKNNGGAYPCFCSPEKLAAARRAQINAGKPPRYDGDCATLPAAAAAARLAAGETAAWRFRMPSGDNAYDDIVRGVIHGGDMGDFIIRRADGDFSFLFVNAVDDVACGVNCVLRGADHIANTPRQLALLRALNMPPPRYGHISLITDAQGKPLSKRGGLAPLRDWRARGFLPAAVLNYLARAGHAYPPGDATNDTLMSATELADNFSLSALGRAATQYDEAQLTHWQKEAIRRLADDDIREWLGETAGGDGAFCQIVRENVVLRADAEMWRTVLNTERVDYAADARQRIAATPKSLYESAARHCDAADWPAFAAAVRGDGGKAATAALRAALSGRLAGPAMSALFACLPAAKRRQRLQAAAALADDTA